MKTTQKKTNKLCLLLSMVAFSIVLLAKPMTAQAALSAPTNIRQTNADTARILLTWDAVPNANSYDVQYSIDGKAYISTNVQVNGTTALISGLTKATTYHVQVATKDSTGVAGSFSQAVEMNTSPEMTDANRPQVTNTNAQSCTIAWAAVPGATGYYIDYGTKSDGSDAKPYGQGYVTGNSLPMNLGANAGYYVWVTAYRTSANGSYKADYNSKGVYVATTPSAPKSLYVSGIENKGKKLTFGFQLTSSLTANTDGYQVEIYSNKNKKLKTINTTSPLYKPSAQNSKFANTPIKYRVRAYVKLDGKNYYGDWSEYAYYAPSAVAGKKLKPTSYTAAKLTWKKVEGAKSYTVYYSTTGYEGSWKVAKRNVKGTSASVKYSRYSKNYYYVQANSVSFKGKKAKVSSPNPNKGKDNFMYYSYTY